MPFTDLISTWWVYNGHSIESTIQSKDHYLTATTSSCRRHIPSILSRCPFFGLGRSLRQARIRAY